MRLEVKIVADKIDAEALRFGQMLQGYREGAKVTQQDIADATGLTKNYISSIERGGSQMQRPDLHSIRQEMWCKP